jgi:hypothetical protein
MSIMETGNTRGIVWGREFIGTNNKSWGVAKAMYIEMISYIQHNVPNCKSF